MVKPTAEAGDLVTDNCTKIVLKICVFCPHAATKNCHAWRRYLKRDRKPLPRKQVNG